MTKYLGPVATLVALAADVAGSIWLCAHNAAPCLIATVPLGAIFGAMVVMNDWPKVWKPLFGARP